MEHLHKIKMRACEALDEVAKAPGLELMKDADRRIVFELVEIVKGIEKIEMLEDEGGYSQTGSYSTGSSYGGGYSGRHLVRAHYSRDSGMSHDGGYSGEYSGRRYSRSSARDGMMENLRGMMEDAGSEKERQAIQRCMEELGRA